MGVKREASHGLTRAMLVGGAPPVPAPPDEYVSITTDRATAEAVLHMLAGKCNTRELAQFYDAVADVVGWGM